ncbi:MAG: SET domain-containing protein-lysine N-methyltransferase [Acidobacteria bacterium]|nr:SET domain-containing protein-lysine N-methyltransferase [Acidobacteriota bacterium]
MGEIYLPKIKRKRSKLHGWGVFAEEGLNKNKRIIRYEGEKISSKESEDREDRYLRRGEIWCFRINTHWVIDANVRGNVARFINHSCTPNCYANIIGGVIWIIAGKRIEEGEELAYDYHTDGDKEIPCRCRPGCQTWL